MCGKRILLSTKGESFYRIILLDPFIGRLGNCKLGVNRFPRCANGKTAISKANVIHILLEKDVSCH